MKGEKNPTKATWRCPRVHRGSATNKLDEGCMASPAIAGRSLFVRTKKALYRIEKK